MEQSVAVAIVLTGLEALGLAFVIVVGVPSWVGTDYLSTPHGFTGISGAAALIFFAYLGFDELGNFVEEMRRPERDLPRALFISMAATTAIYVLVALSAVAVVDAARLGASDAPLALVAGRVLGARADAALSILALAATANTALLLLAAASRSIYGMAAAGVLPKRLARVGRNAVPVPSTLLVLSLLAVLVAVGTLRQVAAMTDAAVLVSFLFVNASLPWSRRGGARLARGASRVAEVPVLSLAFLLCTWLLLHAAGHERHRRVRPLRHHPRGRGQAGRSGRAARANSERNPMKTRARPPFSAVALETNRGGLDSAPAALLASLALERLSADPRLGTSRR